MRTLACIAALALSFATSATAQTCFDSGGVGDNIPTSGTGSAGAWDPNNIDHDLTIADFGSATINIPQSVNGLESLTIQGLSHTWIGDLQCVLYDPNGVGYNIFLRPSLDLGFDCCGNSGDFLGGDYTFVEPGTSFNGPLPQLGDATPGDWDQSWESGDVVSNVIWPAPDENVMNVPLSAIVGPAGMWELRIYDHAALDSGSFSGVEICLGGGIGTNYCISTVNSTGAESTISAAGSASIAANDLVLTANNLPPQPGIFIAGPTQAQVPFFNGFLCIAPVGLQRFQSVANPSGGIITEAVDLATSAAGGVNAVAGSSYHYQRWNRDPMGGGGNANFSDGIEIAYTP